MRCFTWDAWSRTNRPEKKIYDSTLECSDFLLGMAFHFCCMSLKGSLKYKPLKYIFKLCVYKPSPPTEWTSNYIVVAIYWGAELTAYWTALFSVLISARGIAQGCSLSPCNIFSRCNVASETLRQRKCLTRWWFQLFFIFTPILGDDSHFD